MKTLEEIIVELKTETPTLQGGSDDNGYFVLDDLEYERIILERAEWRYKKNQELDNQLQSQTAKASAQTKLAALGLTEEEVASILG